MSTRQYIRNIRILILSCFICIMAISGYATEKAASGNILEKEEKELIEIGLEPFKPKLLWEKKFKGRQISHLDLAKESGDVIVSADDIYLFDRNGNLLWKQGTVEEIHAPWNGHISDNGKVITYDLVDWDTYFTVVFYVDRNNKEKWHKAVPGASHLSPDGSWVVVAPSGGTGSKIVIMNDRGEVVSKHDSWSGGIPVTFSESSKNFGIIDNIKEICRIFDRNGNIVLEFKREYADGIRSFASNGLFSVAGMLPVSIRNLKGDKILSGDSIIISKDGNAAARITWNKTSSKLEIIEISSLKTIKSFKLPILGLPYPLKISYKERYVMLSSDDNSLKEAIILDTVKNAFSKFRLVIPPEDVVRELNPRFDTSHGVLFTKDEKHMVVHVINEKAVHTIKYYQLP